MPDLWMPGVERRDTGRRLSMRGTGQRLFTWHTFETNYTITRDRAFEVLDNNRSDPHFVFNPVAGWLFQMLPANTGGRTLRASGAATNTWGTVHMQVEVIGWAAKPWTSDLTPAGLETLARLMDYLRSWGIPDTWCHGIRPPKYPGPGVTRRQPTESGHFHHAGWSVNNHGDPGAIADPWALVGGSNVPDWQTPDHIRAVQQLLNDVTAAGLTVDGIRGPATDAATLHYQTDYRDDLTPDGSPGPATRTALEEDMSAITDLSAKVDALSTITLTDSQMAALKTGRRTWATTDLIGILGHRIGWMYERTANTRDAVAGLTDSITTAVVDAVSDLPGMDADAIRDKITAAIESVTVTLTVPDPDQEA